MEGRKSMGKYNGQGPSQCKNCGGWEGVHRSYDMACPQGGEDQTGKKYPNFHSNISFEPQDWEEDLDRGATQDKTLFDEYFMAILPAVIQVYLTYTSDDPNELKARAVDAAFVVAVDAMKKRNEYLKAGK